MILDGLKEKPVCNQPITCFLFSHSNLKYTHSSPNEGLQVRKGYNQNRSLLGTLYSTFSTVYMQSDSIWNQVPTGICSLPVLHTDHLWNETALHWGVWTLGLKATFSQREKWQGSIAPLKDLAKGVLQGYWHFSYISPCLSACAITVQTAILYVWQRRSVSRRHQKSQSDVQLDLKWWQMPM